MSSHSILAIKLQPVMVDQARSKQLVGLSWFNVRATRKRKSAITVPMPGCSFNRNQEPIVKRVLYDAYDLPPKATAGQPDWRQHNIAHTTHASIALLETIALLENSLLFYPVGSKLKN